MALSCSLGPDATMAHCGSSGHSDLYGPITSSRQPRPQAFSWPLVVSEVMDINRDPGCRNATNPNMAPHHSLGLDVTRVRGGSTGPNGSVALEDQYRLACLTRSQSSAQSLVVSEVADINTDPGCYSAIDMDMAHPQPQQQPRPRCHHASQW